MSSGPAMTMETLDAFMAAWNGHDVDALMSFMTDDCVFDSAFGLEPCGKRHTGRDAVRTAFEMAWKTVPDAQWVDAVHHLSGDFGVSCWTFTGTAADGSPIRSQGVDVFVFRAGKIQSKSAYRKAPAPQAAAR